ncbi:MAG: proton-conducting transporter membrane subunit [Acidobacteriota bacterium]
MNPVVFLLIPAITAVAVLLFGRQHRVAETISLLGASTLAASVATGVRGLLAGEVYEHEIVRLGEGVSIGLRLDALGAVYALVASFLWVINTLYSIGYLGAKGHRAHRRFHACFAFSLTGAMGIALSTDLIGFFVFYEVLTLVTYPLVTHEESDTARAGGKVYLSWLLGSSLTLLFLAVTWTWSLAGTTAFTPGGLFERAPNKTTLALLLLLFAYGLGKAALMPLHRWLPAAMVAPTPVSALLHAVAVVKAGVFGLLRVGLDVLGLDHLASTGASQWLVYAAGISVLLASTIACFQDDLKRRLAYSTIAQLAYITLGVAVATSSSAAGALLQVPAHAVSKITLFFAVGAIQVAAHQKKLSEIGGIGRVMPWTMGAFTLASLSLIGLPPTVGFLAKWRLLAGAGQAEAWFPLVVLVISTVLAAGYLLPVVHAAFFGESKTPREHGEAPWPMVVALVTTAVASLLLFFRFEPFLTVLKMLGLES